MGYREGIPLCGRLLAIFASRKLPIASVADLIAPNPVRINTASNSCW